jgi:hypothetical protein
MYVLRVAAHAAVPRNLEPIYYNATTVFCIVTVCFPVNFYRTTRRYNPEDSHLRTHRRANLKSCLFPSSSVSADSLYIE